MKTTTRIQFKKAELEVLEELLKKLEEVEKDTVNNYQMVGKETEQARDWKGNLRWDDDAETIPHYNSIWDYVPIPEDELTEEQIAKRKAISSIRATLEKMI